MKKLIMYVSLMKMIFLGGRRTGQRLERRFILIR